MKRGHIKIILKTKDHPFSTHAAGGRTYQKSQPRFYAESKRCLRYVSVLVCSKRNYLHSRVVSRLSSDHVV